MVQIKINGIYYVTEDFSQLSTLSFIYISEDDLKKEELAVIANQASKGIYNIAVRFGGVKISVKNSDIQDIRFCEGPLLGRIFN